MQSRPLVSIILPTYNCGFYIKNAINSVLNQTYPFIELIVVDDGSTDNTPDILQSYQNNKNIRIFTQENKGVAAARNLAIENARGNYLATIDADDKWIPNRLQLIMNAMQSMQVDAVYTNFFIYDKINQEAKALVHYNKNNQLHKEITYEFYLKNGLPLGMAVVKKDWVEKVGGYDEYLYYGEDTELWLRLVKEGIKIGYLAEPTVYLFNRYGSLSRSYSKRIKNQIKYLYKKQQLSWFNYWRSYRSALARYRWCIFYLAYKNRDIKNLLLSGLHIVCSPLYIPTALKRIGYKLRDG